MLINNKAHAQITIIIDRIPLLNSPYKIRTCIEIKYPIVQTEKRKIKFANGITLRKRTKPNITYMKG